MRRGAVLALALTSLLTPASAMAGQAQPAPPAAAADAAAEAASAAPAGIGGMIEGLLGQLDELGGVNNPSSQRVASSETVVADDAAQRVDLTESWTARIAQSGRDRRTTATCTWTLRTRLQAVYARDDRRTLQRVGGAPEATLSCGGGNTVVPVRQQVSLSHALNGATGTRLGGDRCADRAGCRNAKVTGRYACAGARCAGTHRFVLHHSWTLPARYTWLEAPRQCTLSRDGATLSCETRGKRVRIPASGGGISVGNAEQPA